MKKNKQANLIHTFTEVYCRRKHNTSQGGLCRECGELIEYARQRLERCPFDPKPRCKQCSVHCYAEPYRSRIKAVMKYSGMYFVMRGRLDWLLRYFLSK